MSIRIPKAVFSNALKLDPNPFFAVLLLCLNKGDERAARAQAHRIGGGIVPFRKGREALQKMGLIDPDGSLDLLWGQILAQRHAKRVRFGIPFPFDKIPAQPIDSLLKKKLNKTAFMLLMSKLGHIDISISGDEVCDFCGVSRRTVRTAKATLLQEGLWFDEIEGAHYTKAYQGEQEDDEIDELVADVQEGLTHEIAVCEGIGAHRSGLYGSIKNAMPSSYLGFLSQKSPAIARLLSGMKQEEALAEVRSIPRAYLRGFEEGWNAERVLRGHEPETFAG